MDSTDNRGELSADGDAFVAAAEQPPQPDVSPERRRADAHALAARRAIEVAMTATRDRLIAVTASGCPDVFSTTADPEAPRQLPWIHSLAGNAAAVASGIAAALGVQGRAQVRVVAQARDTTGAAVGCLTGLFRRDDDVLFVCYASEPCDLGEPDAGPTSIPLIAMAHRVAYVATASVCDLRDAEAKVTAAIAMRGARYLQIYAPRVSAHRPQAAFELARLALRTGLFPLFEAERGKVVHRTKIDRPAPVTEYLRLDERFDALLRRGDDPRIARIQAIADRNIAQFALCDGEDEAAA